MNRFPRATCTTCRKRLKFPHTLVPTTLYTSNLRHKKTRAEVSVREEDCSCCVCTRARIFGGAWHAFKKSVKAAQNKDKENLKPGLLKLCPHCYHPISQGCQHACGPQAGIDNISDLLGPEKVSKLCQKFLKEQTSSSGDNQVPLKGNLGGRPMKVTVNPKMDKTKKVFGLKETLALRADGNFTSKYVTILLKGIGDLNICRKVDLILKHMRDSLETGTVAPNQRIQIRGFKKLFANLTTTEILTFKDKNGMDIKRPFTYIDNPVEFKTSVATMRQKDENLLTTKFGLDNGQVKKLPLY